jgi:hypothetical protein
MKFNESNTVESMVVDLLCGPRARATSPAQPASGL